MDVADGARIIRAPTRRRRNEEQQLCDRIKLKKVLGLTVCSNAALDVSPISGLLAYPAGCTIVLFNAKRQTQVYLVNTSRKAFTSVAFSRCGRYVATGECGINPAIKVWELETQNGNLEHTTGGNVIAEFVDHKYAVTCVAFSPTSKYLVSVGSQHDMIVNVFDWRSNLKMASNKISSKVSAVSFAEDGSYFVTVGNRHVKYWYLEGGRKYKDPIPLMGRSAILGDLREHDFCAVACGKGDCADSTYAITRQGHLVEFSSRRLLDKWVQCRMNANCICVNGQYIFVGCAESIIRIFNAATLEYVTTLPRTHYLGVDVAQGIHINHIMTAPPGAKYPDCIAMVFDEQRSKVSCVYNDHSLYIWDMRDLRRVGKSHSFLYHSTCIWGVETVPYNIEREPSYTLPEDCFVTCSSDDTIRVWGLEGCANNDIYRKNVYSKDLLKVIYIDDELSFIKDQETIGNDKNSNANSAGYDGRNGVRCIKISHELNHLASGDRSGNIRIYNLENLKMITSIEAHESEVLCLEYSNDKIERKLLASASRDRLIHVFDVEQDYLLLQTLDDHSSSITSIKFVGQGLSFQMVSCGADKSIMFRTFQGNIFLRGTHTSGKTTLYDMEVDSNAKHILTACQDRNIRVYGTQNAKHTKTFKGSHSDEGSLIKLSLDPSGIYIATSCTDKTLAVYDYYSNECMARMYGHSELVTGLKFTNDCKHLISASGDGCIFIWQVPHDMIVTMQARLSQQRLRSGHAPLPRSISTTTLPMIGPESIKIESPTSPESDDYMNATKVAVSPSLFADELPLTPGYRFSDVGQLPQWAKRKQETKQDISGIDIPRSSNVTATTAINAASSIPNLSSSPSQLSVSGAGVPRARGRWAQRGQFDDTLTDLRSNSESPLGTITTTGSGGLGNTQTSDYNSASSKDIMYNQTYLSEDSSIDSGMETRREMKFIGSSNVGTTGSVGGSPIAAVSNVGAKNNGPSTNRLMPDKKSAGFRFDAQNNDHDGDVEDISDGERTSSDHGMFYNNISPGTPTEFKVTAMNEEELRKSVRRQKFEKCGLTLTGNGSHTASTGTGTSDTEDEGSTPSAENAERSLASTLGGSSENIPQTTNSFLQAALPDGPGNLLERGTPGRRSISAKHNTENGKVSAAPTITKSYTSTKKEELLKVINEAKQKLENGTRKNGIKKLNAIQEVGYRSLRGSHSISDLSLAGNLDGSRSAAAASRYAKTANSNQPSQYYSPYVPLPPPGATYVGGPISSYALHQYQQQAQHFFNSAAPRSVLQQNYQAMRQVQQQYPPYPRHVGVYQIYQPQPPTPPTPTSPYYQQHPQQQRQYSSQTLPAESTTKAKPSKLSLEQERTQTARNPPPTSARKSYGILKNYKSCPVSPVREEVEWENLPNESKQPTSHNEPKRHSVYSDDAKTILDMIHSDTEKMIDEITRKYGDLDADELPSTSQMVTSQSMPTHLSTTLATAKSSCESLEENSLTDFADPNAPKRCVSEFYIYQDYYGNFTPQRKVSLSEILDDNPEKAAERRRLDEAQFLEAQRHSSASFFLTAPFGERKSQESLLSEDFIDGESYCNSMESILSDESDCKSAPLDAAILHEKQQLARRHAGVRNFILQGQMDAPTSHQMTAVPLMVTKSYGSSPNACSSFDYYMQHRQLTGGTTSSPYESFDVSSYDLSNLTATATTGKLKSTAAPKLPNSETYPRLSEHTAGEKSRSPRGGQREEIPTLSYKNKQYSSGVNKSMSKDFAQQRHCKNSNPLQVDKSTYEDMMFSKKTVKPKPPIPAKPQKLVSTLTSTVESKETMKKSCSFDIDTTDIRCNSRTASVVRKFERNLQKFEREKQAEQQAKRSGGMRPSVSSGTLTTQSCLKKHSKFDTTTNAASRRATSVRTRQRPKISVRFNTVSQIKYTPSDKRLSSDCSSTSTSTTTTCPLNDVNSNEDSALSPPPPLDGSLVVGSVSSCEYEEKTFEMYIAGNGNEEHENMNMDSLKLYTKPELQALVDEIKCERERDTTKHQKNLANEERTLAADASTSNQCKNIAKKIDIIQKLIEMEERKLEQIRQATESRMRPFECNSKQKGYVKSLTMNFDMLAKGIEQNIENEQRRLRADDNEDDLCAYARHMKRNVSLPDVLESAHMKTTTFVKITKGTELVSDTASDGVEYAKEAVADSDVDDAEEVTPTDEHESEKIRNDFDEKDEKGNPKSLLPMPIEESSIRRACSLSDLHMGNMGKMGGGFTGKSNGNPKPSVAYRNSSASRSTSKRNSLQLKGSSTVLSAQSTSMGVLNQGSDSEIEDTNRGRSASTSQNRTNGPTAAARQYGNKNSIVNNNRRKTLPTTFSNAAPPQDDSSSEEAQGGSSSHSSKPIVPPRPRNLAFDHKTKVAGNPNGEKRRSGFEPTDFVLEGSDPKAQVHNVINKLYSTTQTVMQLHANLRNCEESLMLKELENAVIMTQNMLTNITQTKSDRTNLQHAAAYSSTEQANLENGDYLMMVNNCADLLSNYRSKHKPDDCENNS